MLSPILILMATVTVRPSLPLFWKSQSSPLTETQAESPSTKQLLPCLGRVGRVGRLGLHVTSPASTSAGDKKNYS